MQLDKGIIDDSNKAQNCARAHHQDGIASLLISPICLIRVLCKIRFGPVEYRTRPDKIIFR